MVRRLPVLSDGDAEAGGRSRLAWVGVGAGFIVVAFIPLALVMTPIGVRLAARVVGFDAEVPAAEQPRVDPAMVAALTAVPPLLAYAGAATAGGALVGRFFTRFRIRDAALSGALAGACLWALAVLGRALAPWPVAVATLAVLAGGGALFSGLGRRIAQKRGSSSP